MATSSSEKKPTPPDAANSGTAVLLAVFGLPVIVIVVIGLISWIVTATAGAP